jgi:hypothetical protein
MYAVTMKNVFITAGFAIITGSQFVLGMVMTIVAARWGGNVHPFLDRKNHSQIRSFAIVPPQFNRCQTCPLTHSTCVYLFSPMV